MARICAGRRFRCNPPVPNCLLSFRCSLVMSFSELPGNLKDILAPFRGSRVFPNTVRTTPLQPPVFRGRHFHKDTTIRLEPPEPSRERCTGLEFDAAIDDILGPQMRCDKRPEAAAPSSFMASSFVGLPREADGLVGRRIPHCWLVVAFAHWRRRGMLTPQTQSS
jgi:hypothetical protein